MRSIRWKLTFAYAFTVLVSISGLGLYLSRWTDDHYIASLKSQLLSEGRFLGRMYADRSSEGEDSLQSLAAQTKQDYGSRVTIIRADGLVLADSDHEASRMEPHGDRPEIRQALEHGHGSAIRYSETLRTRMLYVAVRLGSADRPHGVVRLARSLAWVEAERGRMHRAFFVAGFIVFCTAALIVARIASNITRPIIEINAVARLYGKGDLSHRVSVDGEAGDEIHQLAQTLNTMASDLQHKMSELAEEKAKLEAVFKRTDDGLMVVDDHGRIRILNPAAARLLGITPMDAEDKTVIEGTLNHDLSKLAEDVLRTRSPLSKEIRLANPEQTYLNVYVTPLEKPDGLVGAALVMHDLTAARSMDSMRRDFVANVSHELRNPLASMKAMAETIVLRSRKDPEIAADFAQKIIHEADRLTTLSEDLLDLAAIEAGRRELCREVFPLSEVTGRVVAHFTPFAMQKDVHLSADVPEGLLVRADREAVLQVLVNLADNAVKYTGSGGRIGISASARETWVEIRVSDTGMGIPKEDLSRIFERFYRVDRARSWASGGTGLGLSIVRHLVEAHGGEVSVDSVLGQGSAFVITIPTA